MFGSGRRGLKRLLGEKVIELQARRDPLFGGVSPEPLPQNLQASAQLIAADPAPLKIGLVFDGDADRIAALDGQGHFLSPQVLIPILIDHLGRAAAGCGGKSSKPSVARSCLSRWPGAMACRLRKHPWASSTLPSACLSTQVLLGGEESGGIGYLGHTPRAGCPAFGAVLDRSRYRNRARPERPLQSFAGTREV
jgi:phosphomannomutase